MKVAKPSIKAGDFVGALITGETDEIMIIMNSGKVLRSKVSEVRPTSRATIGVRFAKPDSADSVIAVTKNAENVEIDE
jgi:DNA gyrase subunit A